MLSQIFAWNSVVRNNWFGILQGLICTGLPERKYEGFILADYQDGHIIEHMLFLDKFVDVPTALMYNGPHFVF